MDIDTSLFTPQQWDDLFDQFLASGLSQVDFCKERALPRHRFAYRYRRSPKFAGVLKGSPTVDNATNTQSGSGFRAVHKKPSSFAESHNGDCVSILIGQDVRLECPAHIGVDAIVHFIRETRP